MALPARLLNALLLAGVAGTASAQGALQESPACRQALQSLDAKRAQRAPRAEIEPLRRRAAVACLGGGAASRAQGRGRAPAKTPPAATAPKRAP